MKHLHFKVKEPSIGWLEWDQGNSSVNLISSSFIKELSSLIKTIESAQLKALIFSSKKENSFCAGADIKEIQKIQESKQVESLLKTAHHIFSKFENLKISKISVIEGVCLGGGLEWALCFDYRLASQSRFTKLGFPEVRLGLIPGLGGCIRLPKLIGLRKALKLILTGKSLTTKQALSIGLINEQVPSFVLKKRALELARQIVQGKALSQPKNNFKEQQTYSYWLEFFLKPVICFLSKKQILAKTKGFYPAPLEAKQLIEKTCYTPLSKKALNQEDELFIKLLQTQSTKNLIHLWILTDKAKKTIRTAHNYKPIQKIAVIGAGLMGHSISCLLVDKGFTVRLIDNREEALCQALQHTKKLFEKQKSRRQINSYEFTNKLNNLSVSQNFWGLKTCDLIIEALPEDLRLKQKLIAKISKKANSKCLFASNTSSLSILELAKSNAHPSHFFGLHFFNPVHKMPLLEICMTEDQKKSHPQVLSFIKQLGKIPLFVKDSPGFVVNRILVSYLSECLNLLEEGYDIKHIDSILKSQCGMPLGPFELMDKIGLDICLKTVSHLEQKGIYFKTPKWTKDLTTLLGQGEKSQKGFYIYYEDKEKTLNPKTKTLNRVKETATQKDKQLINRVIAKMSMEGNKLIQNKIVQKEEEIDLAMVLGAGFPAFLGGPMQYHKNKENWQKRITPKKQDFL